VWSFILAFIGVIVVSAVILLIISKKERKKMLEKAAAAGAKDMMFAKHIEGLGVGYKTKCEIYLFDDRIEIAAENGPKFVLNLSKVRAAEFKKEQELIETNKSVVGRAMIGTLLVPGLGTIIGGLSGVGTKKKKGDNNHYLIINYENSKGDLEGATFLNNLNDVELKEFAKTINRKLRTQHQVISL
jgi:hypothetical protein